jgi:hypothetical protein
MGQQVYRGARGRLPRQAAGGGIIVVLLVLNGGCGVVRVLYAPQFTEHKSITLTVRRDTTMVVAADTVAATTLPVDIGTAPVIGIPSRPPAGAPASPRAASDSIVESPPPEQTPGQPEIAPAEAPPSISVALPEEQRDRLERIARAEIAMAESIIDRIAPRLTADKDREKLQTVRGLVEQTHAALDREDNQAAANLAHKAKLLATELLSR